MTILFMCGICSETVLTLVVQDASLPVPGICSDCFVNQLTPTQQTAYDAVSRAMPPISSRDWECHQEAARHA